jgi:hypothetical protein
MLPVSAGSRYRHAAPALAGLAVALSLGSAGSAMAQSAACGDIGKQLTARKSIVDRLQKLGNKNIDPRQACTFFGQLVQNGSVLIKWVDANKEWCQVPDTFAEGIKADHERAQTMRGKACAVAAQVTKAEKRAREAGPGGGGLLGGNSLEGQYRMPQGAL